MNSGAAGIIASMENVRMFSITKMGRIDSEPNETQRRIKRIMTTSNVHKKK